MRRIVMVLTAVAIAALMNGKCRFTSGLLRRSSTYAKEGAACRWGGEETQRHERVPQSKGSEVRAGYG